MVRVGRKGKLAVATHCIGSREGTWCVGKSETQIMPFPFPEWSAGRRRAERGRISRPLNRETNPRADRGDGSGIKHIPVQSPWRLQTLPTGSSVGGHHLSPIARRLEHTRASDGGFAEPRRPSAAYMIGHSRRPPKIAPHFLGGKLVSPRSGCWRAQMRSKGSQV
jgi:hypothetical protein